MHKILLTLILLIAIKSNSQSFISKNFKGIENVINNENDTLYVINFWATWCKPCIEELPYFDEITTTYKNDKVKVLLVSMDFKSEIDEKLPAFLEKKQLKSEVWWFNEEKHGDYMGKIESEWYGAIPFTLLIKGSENFRYWKEGKWEKEELFKKVAKNL